MYVKAGNGWVFFQQKFELTVIRGFEPYGVVSWSQGVVMVPQPPLRDFFCVFAHFSKFSVFWGKTNNLSFLGCMYVQGKTNIC